MRKILILVAGIWVGASSASWAAPKHNVILMMIDGVRWQEVFFGVDPERTSKDSGPVFSFPAGGSLTGNVRSGHPMTVGNQVFISLPGYQSIMAGKTQPCETNECGRITVETLEERLVRELKLKRTEVATIASWENIRFAVEHDEGSTFVNAGQQPLEDGSGDPELVRVNREQVSDEPMFEAARNDTSTFAQGLRYLKWHKPRFLYLSFNDSDEWAHRNDYPRYLETLRRYNGWVQELKATLATMGEYGRNTKIIVTTDHGRGASSNWTDHGTVAPESKYVWLYSTGPGAKNVKSHLDIRPLIERELGLQ